MPEEIEGKNGYLVISVKSDKGEMEWKVPARITVNRK